MPSKSPRGQARFLRPPGFATLSVPPRTRLLPGTKLDNPPPRHGLDQLHEELGVHAPVIELGEVCEVVGIVQ